MITFVCSECGTKVKGRTEYDAEVAFDQHRCPENLPKLKRKPRLEYNMWLELENPKSVRSLPKQFNELIFVDITQKELGIRFRRHVENNQELALLKRTCKIHGWSRSMVGGHAWV